MKSLVIIEKESYYYKRCCFNDDSIQKLISKIKNKLDIVILQENIYTKSFNNVSENFQEFLTNFIKREFGNDSGMLIHYDYFKDSNKLHILSIKKEKQVEKLSKNINELTVRPIQSIIVDYIVKKKIKEKNCIIITKIKNIVYYIELLDGMISENYYRNIGEYDFYNELSSLENKVLIIDEKFKSLISDKLYEKNTILYERIGEVISERILKI